MRQTLGRRGVAVAAGVIASTVIASTAIAGSTAGPTYNLKKLKGSITSDGSSTVGPYTTAAAELFRKAGATGVKVTVGISGTGGGFQRFCANELDLSNASRPMKISEAQSCKNNSVGSWRAFTVAIWDQGSKIDNWKDVRAGFPDVPLKLFGPGTGSGTFDYFTEVINGKSKRSRSDYQASEDDNVLVQGVSGEHGGMGYFGFSYYEENKSRLNAVQVRNPKTGQCVSPGIQSVQGGSYKPLARPTFIYAKGSSFTRREVQAFLDYIFDNEQKIATRADFVPLTRAQLKRARTTFALAVKAANNS
jgi:phosphate transport system substrate-binding protein